MTTQEAAFPRCRASTRRPRLALRLWLYRIRLRLLCRVAFAGRTYHHAE